MEEVKKQGMESLFCPYEIALALKELGFDKPCFGRIYADGGSEQLGYSYKNSDSIGIVTSCSAPTYSQAFKFFREKYGLSGVPNQEGYEIFEKDNINTFWGVY